ncbi:beta-methylgalactoside transporter inner membrane component [Mycoplasmopsis californica]|uniref:ABC transporter permease n=1 Tax=Mycoplasmopsis equigenitalium TaxID=114883 RepID=A0ABY5J5P3_9BACT|nr:ABC transporter permease [Mycoplasmopsis equigenitalium]UUD37285.1 hypothetical protein NPA09_01795 [Mycoplasmopsis equigenitalium]VEU69405.1 beta-methylgalactoside transporter inner membrane component [Mycoplasmopsis californica]
MNKVNNVGIKVLKFLRGDSLSGALSKIKGSIFAILLGMLVSILPMLIDVFGCDASIPSAFRGLFKIPLDSNLITTTIISISIFILVGGGIGISFKTGLFNIGASGQMMLSGGLSVLIALTAPAPQIPRILWVLILFVFSMIVGALLAGIAGFLKAFGNVHEVITTIMLNWIVYFVMRQLTDQKIFRRDLGNGSKKISEAYQLDITSGFEVATVFIVAIAFMIILAFIFKYTKLGFSMRMNGLNTSAAKYSGINNRLTTIYSMLFSGALAGAGGYLYYTVIKGAIPDFMGTLDTVGFEAITVTLLSFSSPIGAIPAGIFYGILHEGTGYAYGASNMGRETFGLVIGIIILFASLSAVFASIHPYIALRNKIIEWSNSDIKNTKAAIKESIRKRTREFNTLKKNYLVDQKNIVNDFLKQSSNPKALSVENYELAQKLGYHKFIAKYLQNEYNQQLKSLNAKLKANEISLVDHSVSLRRLLHDFTMNSENQNINFLKTEKIKFKSDISAAKNKYKLYKNDMCREIVDGFWQRIYAQIYTLKNQEVVELKNNKQQALTANNEHFDKLIEEAKKDIQDQQLLKDKIKEISTEKTEKRKEILKKHNSIIVEKQLAIWKERSELKTQQSQGGK